MSTFNSIWSRFKCPHCKEESEIGFEIKIGFRNQLDFNIGDTYPWISRKSFKNGGRPDNGNVNADAYGCCELCGRDFFVYIKIREDIIKGLEINQDKKGYIQQER